MKKFFLLFFTLLITITLAACGGEVVEEPTVFELNTNLTDANLLDPADFSGRDFFRDGIGEVRLDRCIDGDTTRFVPIDGGPSFSVRYLGIDAPESTGAREPWGQAASDFVCEVLTNATTIVLQRDPGAGNIDSTGSRELAYVWYDGRLLNLELVELAFAVAQGTGSLHLHGDLLLQAITHAQRTGRRIWGEEDPNFDDTIRDVTITELLEDPDLYLNGFFNVEGIIVSVSGVNFTISDGNREIFVFTQFQATPAVAVGHRVRLDNISFVQHSSGLQLTNFSTRRITVLEQNATFE